MEHHHQPIHPHQLTPPPARCVTGVGSVSEEALEGVDGSGRFGGGCCFGLGGSIS